ncbi:MAG: flagellar hook-length control protein FliK [Proteobacteria bacterium]|nr:flagellar hook-length control protein FliK [Pseudomonadota bacterium]
MINPVLNTAPPASPQNAKQNGAQTDNGFGTVLARQMGDNAATDKTAVSEKPPASKNAHGEKSKTTTDQVTQDQTTPPAVTTNPLAALLLDNQSVNPVSSSIAKAPENQTIKAAAGSAAKSDKDKTPQTTDTNTNPLAALLNQMPNTAVTPNVTSKPAPANPEIKTVIRADAGTNLGKTLRSAVSAHQANSTDLPAGTSVKAEQLPAIKAGTEIFKAAELAANLPAPSAQALAQSAGAQIAASFLPNTHTATQTNTTIAAPLGSSAWPDEFSQKISWMSTQQNQVAELHLNPPDLGPMSVVLSISDNQATALFTSPHSAVREAIENAMPKLRESLADSGIMLGNATVSDQPPRDGGSAGFMNQRSHTRTESANAASAEASPIMTPLTATRRHNGMVDTFA